jgi:preprotein translocase subunit SecY
MQAHQVQIPYNMTILRASVAAPSSDILFKHTYGVYPFAVVTSSNMPTIFFSYSFLTSHSNSFCSSSVTSSPNFSIVKKS